MSENEKWLAVFLALVTILAPGPGILCWVIFGFHIIDKYVIHKKD